MKKISIAIDGPSASGKSSVAKIIAKKLNYVYIDTGAMYRCVGYYCLQNNIDLKDEQAVINVLDDIKITMDSSNNVYLNDVNVSNQIRQDKVSMSASEVSKYQEVRDFWLNNNVIWQKLVELFWMEEILERLYFLMQSLKFINVLVLKLELNDVIWKINNVG